MVKVILVWFDRDDMQDLLIGNKINLYSFSGNNSIENIFKDYADSMTQLYKNDWVFFDDIFKYIDKGIRHQRNPLNVADKYKCSDINCFPSLLKNVEHFVKLNNIVIISKRNSRYEYMLWVFDNIVYLSNETKVERYLNNNMK